MIRLLLPTEPKHHAFQRTILLALAAVALIFFSAGCSASSGSGATTESGIVRVDLSTAEGRLAWFGGATGKWRVPPTADEKEAFSDQCRQAAGAGSELMGVFRNPESPHGIVAYTCSLSEQDMREVFFNADYDRRFCRAAFAKPFLRREGWVVWCGEG